MKEKLLRRKRRYMYLTILSVFTLATVTYLNYLVLGSIKVPWLMIILFICNLYFWIDTAKSLYNFLEDELKERG